MPYLARRAVGGRPHRLAACGIARPWSGYDWSGLPGTGHLVATWEMMVDVAWARSFSPSDLRPRADVIDGRRCVMDTFLYAQRRTSPGRIRCLDAGGSIVVQAGSATSSIPSPS